MSHRRLTIVSLFSLPYKKAGQPTIYYVTPECSRRPFANPALFFSYFKSWNAVVTADGPALAAVAPDKLGFMPWGPLYDPKYGALVKTVADPKVYLILNDKKFWITSETVFSALNYNWGWIEDVDAALLAQYAAGGEIAYTDHHPNYTLIKYADSPNVYRLEPDASDPNLQVKYHIPDEETFAKLGFRFDRIVEIKDTEVYPDKKPAGAPGTAPTSTVSTETVPAAPPAPDSEADKPTASPPVSTLSGVSAEFLTCPTQSERAAFDADFELRFLNYPATPTSSYPNTRWSEYPYQCDLTDKNPTRLTTYNTLRFLKHLEFDRPLPFTAGRTLYEYLTLKTLPADGTIYPKLVIEPVIDCNVYSTGGRGARAGGAAILKVTMSGNFSRLYPVLSGSASCASSLPASGSLASPQLLQGFVYHPIYRSALLVHEAHHAIGHNGHTGVAGGDATIEEMGAWAAQFYFHAWVALFSANADDQTKQLARTSAEQIIDTRFSQSKCPTDPALKTIVNEIKKGLCP